MQLQLGTTEKTFIKGSVEDNLRIDGRNRLDYRKFDLSVGVVPDASGSCLLGIVGDTTRVLAVVKLSVTEENEFSNNDDGANSHLRNEEENGGDELELYEGRIRCFVDFGCQPRRGIDGRKLDEMRIEYGMLIDRVLNQKGVIDFQKLQIVAGKVSWSVSIDLTVLTFGGNLLDSLFLAARAALCDTRIPALLVEGVEYSLDEDKPDDRFLIDDIPVCVTMTKIGSKYVVDAREQEEACAEVFLTVAVDKQARILAIQKGLSGGIPSSLFTDMIQTSKQISALLIRQQEAALSRLQIV